jgi:hypothetical protein
MMENKKSRKMRHIKIIEGIKNLRKRGYRK